MYINGFTPGKPLSLEFVHADGVKDVILANHTYNEGQIGLFCWFSIKLNRCWKAKLSPDLDQITSSFIKH
jgi:hypothetical protein